MQDLRAEEKIAFLLEPDAQALLAALCRDGRDDLALSGASLLRGLSAPRRIALLEQRKLRCKALRKCPQAMRLVFTPLGLEQMTHAELSRYKAGRLPAGLASLADLGCGLGGDSFHVPTDIALLGLDRSLATLQAYRHNVTRFRPAAAVRADLSHSPARAEAAWLDPSRRREGSRERWGEVGLSPGWAVMERLIARYGNMGIKLGPGLALPSFLEDYEWEYLGLRDECLEVVVWTGRLGRPGWVRAVELPQGAWVEAPRGEIPDSFGSAATPGTWLFEPVKAVVRAHLFGVLAERHGLWPIDARLAYLTGNSPAANPLLKAYRILRELPFDIRAIREFLRREEVGRVEIKKRGVDVVPEALRRDLGLGGPGEGTLFFTRSLGRKTVFWARREAALPDPTEGPVTHPR